MAEARTRPELGPFGEELARRHLEAKGYRFVERNWRCRSGEIDLVMTEHDELVFVEVKARRGERSGRAEEAVSPAKVRRLLATGEWYLAEHPEHEERLWRCDLVAITIQPVGPATIDHYINAIVEG